MTMLAMIVQTRNARNPKNPAGVIAAMPITSASQPSHAGNTRLRMLEIPVAIMSVPPPAASGRKKSLLSALRLCAAAGDR
jgi:hypothetical protein